MKRAVWIMKLCHIIFYLFIFFRASLFIGDTDVEHEKEIRFPFDVCVGLC